MAQSDTSASVLPQGGGAMGALMRVHDWSTSPLGEPDGWPLSLRNAIGLLLPAQAQIVLFWGAEYVALYNDAYAPTIGDKHPRALGRPAVESWTELWDDLEPLLRRVRDTGETVHAKDRPFYIERHGFGEEVYFDISYSPVPDDSGAVGGVLCIVSETTNRVLAERTLRTERDRQQRLLDHAPGFVITMRGPSHTVDFVSEGHRKVFGSQEWVGRPIREILPELQQSELFEQIDRVYTTGEPYSARALPVTHLFHGREETHLLDFVYAPVFSRDGSIEGVFCQGQDVTPRVESEARLQRALDIARLGTFEWMLSDDTVMLDERSREIFGFAAHEGRTAQDVFKRVHPDDYAVVHAAAMASATELSRLDIAYRLRLPNGSVRHIQSLSDAIAAVDGKAERMVGVFADVTERAMAELALRKSEERLRELNETLAARVEAAIAERDRTWNYARDLLVVANADGELQAVNPAWTTILGWQADELVGRNYREFLHADDHDITREALASAEPSGGFPAHENRYRHKDASYRWISWVAAPAGNLIYATGRDVTAEKRRQAELDAAEAARRDADALYRAYFEHTAESLFVVGVQEDGSFTVEDLNPAHQTRLGYRLADVQGKRIDELVPPSAAELITSHYRRVVTSGSVYQYRETFDIHGEVSHWDTVLVPVRNDEGTIVRLIGSSRELTRQVAIEEQLRQAQKMEAMGQLTGGVAHDFNNLLTPIVGVLDMLQRRRIGGGREQRLIAAAAQSADRAKTLVQRLLAFARRQPLQPVPVDVAKLVRGMAELVASTTGPQIKVVVDAPEDLAPAKADPNQLEMALLNLAVNARDAMQDGGTLRISAATDVIALGTRSDLRPGTYVRLSVADTGVGMDEATAARAVEPFFSTKGIGKGTGLGLSMVHGLVSQLGGALRIRSKLGLGTNIDLWLPRSSELPSSDDDPGVTDNIANSGTALLIDDEEYVRVSTADMLADLGYRVIEAASAEAALALVEASTPIDLVLTDHLMPGMSGTEFARLVRQRHPDLPILVVSGYADVEGIAPDLPRLSKPFRKDELAATIASLSVR